MSARLSLSMRLSLLFAACTACVSLFAGLLFSRASEAHFVELDQQLLSSRLEVFRNLLQGVQQADQLPGRLSQLRSELAQHPELGLKLQGADGQIWFSQLPISLPSATESALRELHTSLDQQPAAQLTLLLDITHHQHFLQRMQRLIWLTMSLSALATALLGAWAARRSLQPLRRMGEVAAQVSADSLTTRLDADQLPLELRGLASELNAMLARLEEAFQRLSAFSADIAHELRTPLSGLLTQSQVVLSRSRSLEDYREALHGNLEELQRLTSMVNDMLFLAKADHGLLAPHRQPLDMAAEVDALLEFYAPLAEEQGIRLERQGEQQLLGDRSLLRRLLANLLDNALRFCNPGGCIRIQLEASRLKVENTGPSIPAEHLPRLFNRFYRADPARREGQGEHVGLGLPICRSIVQAHAGSIHCQSADGWTCFSIEWLPSSHTADELHQ